MLRQKSRCPVLLGGAAPRPGHLEQSRQAPPCSCPAPASASGAGTWPEPPGAVPSTGLEVPPAELGAGPGSAARCLAGAQPCGGAVREETAARPGLGVPASSRGPGAACGRSTNLGTGGSVGPGLPPQQPPSPSAPTQLGAAPTGATRQGSPCPLAVRESNWPLQGAAGGTGWLQSWQQLWLISPGGLAAWAPPTPC